MRLLIDTSCLRADRVLEGTLAWLTDHVSFFDPFKDGPLRGLCEIPLAELAILTLSSLRCPPRESRPELDMFLEMLEVSYHRPEFRERPFREPECLVSHLMVGAALVHGGRLKERDYLAGARLLLSHSTVTAPSLAPHRMLELRHVLDLAGVDHDLPSYQTLYGATSAARRLNPVFMSKAEVYLLTHVIFYTSDVAQLEARGVEGPERRRLASLSEQLLGMHIVSRNWDLTAELIIVVHALRESCAFMDVAWKALIQAQRPDGSVPGLRATTTASSTDWAGEVTDEASAVYHTTLVCAIAALVELMQAERSR